VSLSVPSALVLIGWTLNGSVVIAQSCQLTQLTPGEVLLERELERTTDSDAFQAVQLALGAGDRVFFADSTGRIRTIDSDGRLRTLAGNGRRGAVAIGPALASTMPTIGQVAVSPGGLIHFSASGRIYKIEEGQLVAVAGSGRAGFNGESAPPLELNLGGINNFAFASDGTLYIADGFLRVRRLGSDGVLRTFAGSTRPYEFGGNNGDDGLANRAALQQPRQVVPLRDGTVWIRDLRALRSVGPDGRIRLLTDNFDPQAEILLTPEGNPVAAAPGRVTPLDNEGRAMLPGLFPGFTGNPRAIGTAGLYAINSNAQFLTALFRWSPSGQAELLAGAPRRSPASGVSVESFGVWVESTSSLIYRGTLDGASGWIEARSGQPLRLIAGRGSDAGDPEGKPLSALALNVGGLTADNEGRLFLLDLSRSRILIADSAGSVTVLKDARQQPVPVAGLFDGNSRRLAVDAAGNVYWAFPATPSVPGGEARSQLSLWTRSSGVVSSVITAVIDSLVRLPNGSVAAITGPSVFERSLRRIEPTRLAEIEGGLDGLGIQSAALLGSVPYFVNAPQLFRGATGNVEVFTNLTYPSDPGRPFVALFLLPTSRGLLIRAADGGFYRLENPEVCARAPQPKIASGGVVNAAGFGYADTVSSWQLVTVFGSGLGPRDGQGITLDGLERASGQPAPFPTLLLGQRLPNGTLAGTTLPVIFANETQMTVQVPFAPEGESILFWSWNGLLLKYANPIRVQVATPGVFVQGSGRDGPAAALNQDNTPNSAQNPARRGSIIQFYLTGLGPLRPPLDGAGAFNSSTTLQRLAEPIVAKLEGSVVPVEFSGAAPGFIGGLYQVNVRIPAEAPVGRVSLDFEILGQSVAKHQLVVIYIQ
jgi:uncharacterized protein (TIGR03437 family)